MAGGHGGRDQSPSVSPRARLIAQQQATGLNLINYLDHYENPSPRFKFNDLYEFHYANTSPRFFDYEFDEISPRIRNKINGITWHTFTPTYTIIFLFIF